MFDLERFVRLRPFLFHLTAVSNVDQIRRAGELFSAQTFLRAAGREPDICIRRDEHLLVHDERSPITLRDQRPLHRGSIAFEGGWAFEDVLRDLNRRVFFWPGDARGPIPHGRRHFARYAHESVAIVCAATQELFANAVPELCRYNSGSPRCSGGMKSPRGPDTFLPLTRFAGTPGDVVEVTFRERVRLPEHYEIVTVDAIG